MTRLGIPEPFGTDDEPRELTLTGLPRQLRPPAVVPQPTGPEVPALQEQIRVLRDQLAALQGQAEAYQRALVREREAVSREGAYAMQLLALNERLRGDLDRARRAQLELLAQHADVLAELGMRDRLGAAFELASRTITGRSAAELTARLNDQIRSHVPPADDDPFGPADPTRLWARGTLPDNDTEVVDVPLPRGAR